MQPDMAEPFVQQSEFANQRRKARSLCQIHFSGPVPFRVLACFGGLLSCLTSIISVEKRIVDESFENIPGIVLGIYGAVFGFVVVILETAGFSLPLLRNRVHDYAKCLVVVWARSMLYMLFGSLQLINATFIDYLGGGFLIGVGLIGFLTGMTAHIMLRGVRRKVSVLELKKLWDETDISGNGYLCRRDLVLFWEKGRLEYFGADLRDYLLVSSQEMYPLQCEQLYFDVIYSWLTGVTLEGYERNCSDEKRITTLVKKTIVAKQLAPHNTFTRNSPPSADTKARDFNPLTSAVNPNGEFAKKYAVIGQGLGVDKVSVVYEARNIKTRKIYAAKSVLKAHLAAKELTRLQNQVTFMSKVQHTSILRMEEYIEEGDAVYYVTELMKGGILFDKIVEKSFYPEIEAKILFRSILKAIQYLHSYGVVHRDVKPENILLKRKNSATDVVLDGFKYAEMSDHRSFQGNFGTLPYKAPELLKGEKYGLEVDMWSAGITLHIILCGYRPFDDQDKNVLREKIKAGVYEFEPDWWDSVSIQAKDLVASLLVVDPKFRLSATDALRHDWFRTGSEGDV